MSWWDEQQIGIAPGEHSGLPAPTPFPFPGPSSDNFPGPAQIPGNTTPSANGNPMDREYIKQQLAQLMQAKGITPGPRGSGPSDIEYYTDQILATGGWQGGNAGYWKDRWNSDAGGGGGTLSSLTNGGKFSPDDPSYAFRRDEALNAFQKGAAMRGNIFTGGAQHDLMALASNLASQEYGAQFGRQYSLADLGLRGTIAGGGSGGYGTGPGQVYLPPSGQIGPGQSAAGSSAFGSAYTNPAQPYSLAKLKY